MYQEDYICEGGILLWHILLIILAFLAELAPADAPLELFLRAILNSTSTLTLASAVAHAAEAAL